MKMLGIKPGSSESPTLQPQEQALFLNLELHTLARLADQRATEICLWRLWEQKCSSKILGGEGRTGGQVPEGRGGHPTYQNSSQPPLIWPLERNLDTHLQLARLLLFYTRSAVISQKIYYYLKTRLNETDHIIQLSKTPILAFPTSNCNWTPCVCQLGEGSTSKLCHLLKAPTKIQMLPFTIRIGDQAYFVSQKAKLLVARVYAEKLKGFTSCTLNLGLRGSSEV